MLTLTTKKTRKDVWSVQVSTFNRFPAADPTDEQEADEDFVQESPSVVLQLQDFDVDGNTIGKTRSMDLMADHPGVAVIDQALEDVEATIAAEVGADNPR